MAKRLGIVSHLFAQPVFAGLKGGRNSGGQSFDLVEGEFAQLAEQLRQGKLDGAFLSPIEYAKEYLHYKIVPTVCALSEGESGAARLVFNEHLHDLKTIAIDARFPSEIVLLHLIMMEKYDIKPQYLSMAGSLDEALSKADAALVVDRGALDAKERPNIIDLVDEWFDLTGMPFVHGFWIVREQGLSDVELNALVAGLPAIEALPDLDVEQKEYLANFRCTLDEEAVASIDEFFRMAYYHGMLKDIPDLRMQTLEQE